MYVALISLRSYGARSESMYGPHGMGLLRSVEQRERGSKIPLKPDANIRALYERDRSFESS